MLIHSDLVFWGLFAKYVSNRKSDNAILFRSIELVNKKPIRMWFGPKLTSLKFFEKNHMAKMGFFSPLKSLNRRLILWKLKLFHFSSIKSSRRVISSFWCYRKFLLTSETILDTLDVCWNRLEDFLRPSFKNFF